MLPHWNELGILCWFFNSLYNRLNVSCFAPWCSWVEIPNNNLWWISLPHTNASCTQSSNWKPTMRLADSLLKSQPAKITTPKYVGGKAWCCLLGTNNLFCCLFFEPLIRLPISLLLQKVAKENWRGGDKNTIKMWELLVTYFSLDFKL